MHEKASAYGREGRQTKAPRAGAGLGGSFVVAITGLAVPSETQQARHLNADPHRWFRHRTQFRQLPRSRLFLGTAATNIALHRRAP